MLQAQQKQRADHLGKNTDGQSTPSSQLKSLQTEAGAEESKQPIPAASKANKVELPSIDKSTIAIKKTKPPVMILPNQLNRLQAKEDSIIQPVLGRPPLPQDIQSYTYALGKGNYPSHFSKALKERGNWSEIPEDQALESSNFYWRQRYLNYQHYDVLNERIELNPLSYVFINHFENTKGITTKTGLIKSLQTYYQSLEKAMRASYTVFDTTPTTFIVSRVQDEDEINLLMNRYKDIARGGSQKERVPVKHCEQNMWLVKPASLNQGKGIEIFRTLREINEYIFHKNPATTSWVVQKYVEHPFLFNDRKFDIRVWAVVTEDYRIYFYKHGYLRTSSSAYDLKDKNNYVHLTNQCLQVLGEGYAQHEEGNTLSYDDLQKYLDDNYSQHNINFEEMMIPRMKDIIIDTFLSVKKKMNASHRQNVYELFGFDFLLDEDFRIWLIECNNNPYLGTPNAYMKTLVPNMCNDMIKLVVDPVLKPLNEMDPNRENDFQLIYRDASKKHGPAVNVRRPFNLDMLYPIPELTPFIGKKKNPILKESVNQRLMRKKAESESLNNNNAANEMLESGAGELLSSPRNNAQSNSSAMRSRSTGKQIFSLRKQSKGIVGSNNSNAAGDRNSHSVSQVSGRSKHVPRMKKRRNGEGGIIEQVDEEDKNSDQNSSGEDKNPNKDTITVKRSLLCKNLLDQTKELCYQHSAVYKDFDQIFSRIMSRFNDSEIFEEKEIVMACQSLKVVANSGQIVSLVHEKNMIKILKAYESDELHLKYRQEISELFMIIAKNMGLRKIFLNQSFHEILVKNSLQFVQQITVPDVSQELLEINQNAIKLLCMVCSARKIQFYIPGETNLSERLRKRAFDSGTYTLLCYIYNQLKDADKNPYKSIKDHIKDQVLNYSTKTDLNYHQKLISHLKDNPQVDSSNVEARLGQSSSNEERKEFESPALQLDESLLDENNTGKDSRFSQQATPSQNNLGNYASKKLAVSPRTGTSKGRTATKQTKYSSNMNTASQSHTVGTMSQIVAGQVPQTSYNDTERAKYLYEVDTEKLLFSNDKVTVAELWKSKPQPQFPTILLEKLNLDEVLEEAQEKAQNLQKTLDKKAQEARRKEQEKIEAAAKQKEEQMEQRRIRLEQHERRKEEQRKFAEELKRRAEQNALLKQQQELERKQSLKPTWSTRKQNNVGQQQNNQNQVYLLQSQQQQQQALFPDINVQQTASQTTRLESNITVPTPVSGGMNTANVLKQLVKMTDPGNYSKNGLPTATQAQTNKKLASLYRNEADVQLSNNPLSPKLTMKASRRGSSKNEAHQT